MISSYGFAFQIWGSPEGKESVTEELAFPRGKLDSMPVGNTEITSMTVDVT